MQVRSKKGSLVSGNWPGKNVFITYYITYLLHFITHSTVYQNIYLLFLKKISQTHRHKQKSKKKTNQEKRHTK